MLRGEGIFELNGATLTRRPGEGVAGPPHQLRNEAAGPLEFLVVSAPHAHGDRGLAG